MCSAHHSPRPFFLSTRRKSIVSYVTRIITYIIAMLTQVGVSGATMEPRRNTLCAALFNDGTGPAWYRAKIIGATPVGTRVRYIDHGNCATVPASKLRPLDPSYFAFKPQARCDGVMFCLGEMVLGSWGRAGGAECDVRPRRRMPSKFQGNSCTKKNDVSCFDW